MSARALVAWLTIGVSSLLLPLVAVVLLCAGLISAGVVVGRTLDDRAEASLAGEVRRLPVERTALLASLSEAAPIDGDPLVGAVERFAAVDIPPIVDARFGAPQTSVDLPRFVVVTVDGESPAFPTKITARSQTGLDDRSVVVDELAGGAAEGEFGIRLSTTTAEQLGVGLGAAFEVNFDAEDALVRRFVQVLPDTFVLRVVALVEYDDRNDPYWFGDSRLHRAITVDTGIGADLFAFASVDAADLADAAFVVPDEPFPLRIEQRRALDVGALAGVDHAELLDGLTTLDASAGGDGAGFDRPTVDTGLRELVVDGRRRRGFATTALQFALLGSALVAAFAIGEITRTAAVARSSLHRLTVARGASASLPMMATGLQFASAAAVGWGAAEVVTRPAADERPVAMAVACIVAVGVIAAASVGRHGGLGDRRPARRGVRRTLVLTLTALAVVVFARVARQGLPIDRALLDDPIAAAYPILPPLALVVLVAIAVARLVRVAAERATGLELGVLLGVRRAGDDPAAGRPLLVVTALALAVGGTSAAIGRSVDDVAEATSWAVVDAPARVDIVDTTVADAVVGLAPDSARFGTTRLSMSGPTGPIAVTVGLLDLAAYDGLTGGTPADASLGSLMDRPVVPGTGTGRTTVPVIASREIGGAAIQVGTVFDGAGRTANVRFEVIEVRSSFFATSGDWMVADRAALAPILDSAAPVSQVFLSETGVRMLGDAPLVASIPAPTERAEIEAAIAADPLNELARRGFSVAWVLSLAVALATMGVTVANVALARSRQAALLELLGAPGAVARRALVGELVPPVVGGVVGGVVIAVVLTVGLGSGLDLAPLVADGVTGGDVESAVRIRPPLRWLAQAAASIGAATVLLAVVTDVGARRIGRRADGVVGVLRDEGGR